MKEIVQSGANGMKERLLVIHGTPGIGKTTFIGFCCHFLRSTRGNIVAQVGFNTELYDRDGKKKPIDNVIEFLSDTKLCEYIFLLDASSPSAVKTRTNAITVLFSSPSMENYGHFSRTSCCGWFLMPTWRKGELWECFRLVQPKLYENEGAFNEAFEVWGGSPQLHMFKSSVKQLFSTFLTTPELLDMVETVGDTDRFHLFTSDRVKAYQCFLFRNPISESESEPEPGSQKLSFPTNHLTYRIIQVYRKKKPQCLFGLTGTALGIAYEYFMFKCVLCTGSALLPLSLTTLNRKRSSSIPSLKNVIVFKSDDVFKNPLESNVVYQPIASNNMGYDCIVGNFLIQITVGKTHNALKMKVDQFIEPAGGWKVVFLTMTCNEIVIPAIRGLKNFSKKRDVYIGRVDLQDEALIAGAACRSIAN